MTLHDPSSGLKVGHQWDSWAGEFILRAGNTPHHEAAPPSVLMPRQGLSTWAPCLRHPWEQVELMGAVAPPHLSNLSLLCTGFSFL